MSRLSRAELALDLRHCVSCEAIWTLCRVEVFLHDQRSIELTQLIGERLCDQVVSRAGPCVHDGVP
jgi:hypothetical protein